MKKIALITALCMLLGIGAAQADGFSAEAEATGYGIAQVRGVCAPNTNVSLLLSPAGVSYEDCMADPANILYLRQVKSDQNGAFVFTIRLAITEDVQVQAHLHAAGGQRDSSLAFAITAAGEEPPEESFVTVEGARLRIKGTAPSGHAGKRVAIAVVSGGIPFADAQKADIAAFTQLITQNGGAFETTLTLTPGFYQSGIYNVLIREEGQRLLTYPAELFDAEVLESALAVINAADTADKMEAAIKAAEGPFGHKEILESALLHAVCDALVTNRPFARFEDVIDCAVDSFRVKTRERDLLLAVNAASSARRWADMELLLTDTGTDLLGLDVGKLSQITDKKALFLSMCGTVYQSIDDIRAAYETAYTKAKAEQDSKKEDAGKPTKPSHSGGGGGGGSSGGGTVVAPMQTDIPTVPALPELDETLLPSAAFGDLDDAAWAKECIEYFRLNGTLRGDGDGNFRPNAAITREEFVKFLVSVFALEPIADAAPFADERPGAWYHAYLAAARQAGIVMGREDGSFGVGEPITRADLSVMVYRAAQTLGSVPDAVQPAMVFSDFMDIPGYAMDMITALQQAGIISGYGDSRFAPLECATRAQSAKIVYGLIKAGGIG